MRQRSGILVGTVMTAVVMGIMLVGAPDPASASCARTPTIDAAIAMFDDVVVGTVTSTRSGGAIAVVAVEEQWKGQTAGEIEVHGGPDDGSWAEDSRSFQPGVRYLLFLYEPGLHGSAGRFGATYEDSMCSPTGRFTDALAKNRPATATILPPLPPPVETNQPIIAYVALGLVALAATLFVAWAVTTRRPPTAHS